ncbi:MAG TPA: VRR-NUC domain-containing protein [Burkholderia sp.]|nr:VRR-NUC domain-containing protein [Burkholderia sp.]
MSEPVHREIGRSHTEAQPRGKTIPVLAPDDTTYLCARICRCNCNPVISSRGRKLKQRCVTKSIRNDCDAAIQVWKYKGEVGYSMMTEPPSPIMSALQKNHPFEFPLVVRDLLEDEVNAALDLAEHIGYPMRGLLRIPDVIVVKDRWDFDLSQRNIEFVVEIKFPGDSWRRGQRRSYIKIAGSDERLKVLSPKLCECSACEPEKEQAKATAKVPEKMKVPDVTNLLRRIQEHNTAIDREPWAGQGRKIQEPETMADALQRGQTEFDHVGAAQVTASGRTSWMWVVLTAALLAAAL